MSYTVRPKNQYGSAKFSADRVFWLSLGPVSNCSNTAIMKCKTCVAKLFFTDKKECASCNVLGFPLTSLRHNNEMVAWERLVK